MGMRPERALLEIIQLLTEIQKNVRKLNPYLSLKRDLILQGQFLVSAVEGELREKEERNQRSKEIREEEDSGKEEEASPEKKTSDPATDSAKKKDEEKARQDDGTNKGKELTLLEKRKGGGPGFSSLDLGPHTLRGSGAAKNAFVKMAMVAAGICPEEAMMAHARKARQNLLKVRDSPKRKTARINITEQEVKKTPPPDAATSPAPEEHEQAASAEENKEDEEEKQAPAKEEKPSPPSPPEISPWPVLVKKLSPQLVRQLAAWLGRMDRVVRRIDRNLEVSNKILELTAELKDRLAHESVLASPDLVAKVTKDQETFTNWKKKLEEDKAAYTCYLDKFPDNPFTQDSSSSDEDERALHHMEEARPFPNPWRQLRRPAAARRFRYPFGF